MHSHCEFSLSLYFKTLLPRSAALLADTPFDPVVEIHLLFQITTVDLPNCKSVVRQENFLSPWSK